jgi:apolipoprotein N-acyltransferase
MKYLNIKWLSLISIIEAIGFSSFGLWTLWQGLASKNIERMSTLITEVIVYLILGLLIFLIFLGIQKRKRIAFSPFVLTQLFVIIIGWPLFEDDNLVTQVSGIFVIFIAFLGLITIFVPKNRSQFL